jgi:heme/copper-type cytochrome/quinol oxidase subunit 3
MLHSKFWQGFFAIGPILTFIAMIAAYIFFAYDIVTSGESWNAMGVEPEAREVLIKLIPLIISIIVCILLATGSLVFYLAHAIQNTNLKSDMRIIYIVLFVIFGGISQLVYWLVECQGKKVQTIE